MAGLFGGPDPPKPLPVVNPADTANRAGAALQRRLQAGGTNADQVSQQMAPLASPRQPTLTGLN
jgi:hypothetical protein